MKRITTLTTILAGASIFGMPLWVRLASNLQQCNSIFILGIFMLVYSLMMAFVESNMER
jgi:uncharacterized protein (DUF983 family)